MNASSSPYARSAGTIRNSTDTKLSLSRPASALIALGLLAFLVPLPPPVQAATCAPLQRGILNANNTFSRGTSARHNDYRVFCRGDTRGREVTANHLDDAFDHPNADPEGPYTNRVVLQFSNAYLSWNEEKMDGGNIVILGTVRADSGRNGIRVNAWREVAFWDHFNFDSHANVQTTGGGMGINVSIGDENHYGTLRVRNFGSIATTGGGPSHGNRRGRGMNVTSNGGDAEAINERGGRVVTRGLGGRAVTAGSAGGSATARNRGTIITYGGGFLRGSDNTFQTSEGLRTWADGPGLVAHSVNEAGGVIDARGAGARGVVATTSKGSGTVSIATNQGRVTTRGNRLVIGSQSRSAFGVNAWSENGISRATNEARASIRTYGTGAIGLLAGNSDYLLPSAGQRAEAENRGNITTTGHQSGTARAHGMEAWSQSGTAYATNHNGGKVTTTGRAARGVQASTRDGGPDETAVAVNRGTVSTRGDAFHTSTSVYTSTSVAAFSAGEASAVAINGYEGNVLTRGTGAKGVWAVAYRDSGEAVARNRGRITTYGDVYPVNRAGTSDDTYRGATGLGAYSEHSDATATNDSGGVVSTRGDVAAGVSAWSDGGGNATAVNRGRVDTRGGAVSNLPGEGGRTVGSTGVQAYSADADARVENDSTGRVVTYGKRAFALHAESEGDGSRTSTTTKVINRGWAETRGYNADGALAVALHGGTATNPNLARATNTSGATVKTAGTGSSGLGAYVAVSGGGTKDAYGTAIARNDGTVATRGGAVGNRAGTDAANGVAAAFFAPDRTRIRHAGDVTIVNTGDVTVRGAYASALYAETFGQGTATVQMLGGEVRAVHPRGLGVLARTGTAGQVDTTIAGGSVVAASSNRYTAVEFQGGTTNVRLLESTIDGGVKFGSGRDTLTIRNGRVTGDLDFGPGADTLNVHGDAWLEGNVSGFRTLNLRGRGNLVVRGNTAAPSARAVLENGGLTFSGHFNLGSGSMHIHDPARLTAVLDITSAPPRITATGGLRFDGEEELFVQVTSNITAGHEETYLGRLRSTRFNPITNGTPIQGRTGQVALRTAHGPSTVVEVGHIPLSSGETRTAGTVVTSGVRLGVVDLGAPEDFGDLYTGFRTVTPGLPSSASTWRGPDLMLGGGVAELSAALFGIFNAEITQFAHEETPDGEALAMPGLVDLRARDGGLEYWTRAWAGDSPVLAGGVEATVRGYALGVDAPLGEGFRLGVAGSPGVVVSSESEERRTGAAARLDGAQFALRGSWHGKVFHAGASLSQGRYEAQSVFDNPVAGGGLVGRFDLAQNHALLGAGARLNWSGMQVAPTVSAHAGVLHHGAYTANGSVFRAEIPAFSQRYHGWKSELRLSPARWWRGPRSLRWRPSLHLYTQRTQTTGPGALEVVQRDRAGVLSLSSRARVSGLPRTVHGLGATVDAVRSKNWRLQLGVAGMRADGETDQTVHARLHVRF